MSTVAAMADFVPAATREDVPESFWRALAQLNYFRLFVAITLILAGLTLRDAFLVLRDGTWFMGICATYFLTGWIFLGSLRKRTPAFEVQLVRHVIVDIVCIGALMQVSGSGTTGPGLLLIVSMAAVGMLRQRRHIFFWAALAALVVLAQQLWLVLTGHAGPETLARGGVLAASFFGVALLAHIQAVGALGASSLARERSLQMERMARINARMIQELPYAVMAVDDGGEVLQYNAQAEALLATRFHPGCSLSQCAPQLAMLWSRWRQQQSLPAHPFQEGDEGRRILPRFIELEPSRRQGAVVVLQDMTALEAQAQRMKLASLGMLTANLAHEIRNPLSAIRHAAGLLQEEKADELGTRLIRIINDNVTRLNSLVEDVLALNRRDRMQRRDLALDEVVPRFVAQFSQREGVPEGIIRIQTQGDPHLCMDENHLEQILWNLLRNAWRYCTREPGSIRMRVAEAGRQVELDIINDGPAIPMETRIRLFEPFNTTSKQGTGLGLYIARDLAEVNGASLHYQDVQGGVLFRLSGARVDAASCGEHAR
ncbi:MAG TPA: HAMP domain-containing sensor histidine kinase [Thiobacillaceae bacterium]|nr:HAMP domain-containing sensor histidine kinase [Thiobacillaceae bacterium]